MPRRQICRFSPRPQSTMQQATAAAHSGHDSGAFLGLDATLDIAMTDRGGQGSPAAAAGPAPITLSQRTVRPLKGSLLCSPTEFVSRSTALRELRRVSSCWGHASRKCSVWTIR